MTTQVRFQCPACRQLLAVASRKAGGRVQCPKCGASVLVPDGDSPATSAEPVTTRDSQSQGEAAVPAHESNSGIRISRSVLYAQGILIALVGVIGFLFGMLIGGRQGQPGNAPTKPTSITVQLRLMYKGMAETLAADDGAVAIVLPVEHAPPPADRLPEKEFEPDRGTPTAAQLKTLTDWGGAFARADNHGDATVMLSQPGNYQVLFISRRAKRPAKNAPAADDLATLGRFFQQPQNLLGDKKYRLSTEQLGNDQKLVNDFGASGK